MTSPCNAIIRVGPAGWAYDDWEGIVYPPGRPRSLHPLSLLSTCFDTVEINVTFYRPPNPRHCAAWAEKVTDRPDFSFAVKVWDRFTHHRDTWPAPQEIEGYLAGLRPLMEASRLGVLLIQFPWSFRRTPENRSWLLRVADALEGYPLAVEVRHASWDCEEFYAGLKNRGMAFCNIDQPQLRDSMPPTGRVTAPIGYVRLHGRNTENWFREGAGRNARYDYLYSDEELKPWIDKVNQMKRKVNDLFIVTNNHYHGQAVVNALEIQAALGMLKYGLSEHLIAAYPRLKRILRGDGPLLQDGPQP